MYNLRTLALHGCCEDYIEIIFVNHSEMFGRGRGLDGLQPFTDTHLTLTVILTSGDPTGCAGSSISSKEVGALSQCACV